MKTSQIAGMVLLSALLGTAAASFAVQEHSEEKQDHSQEKSHRQAKPQPQHIQKQQRAQQPRQEQRPQQQQHAQQQRAQQQRAQQQNSREQHAQQQQRAQQEHSRQDRGNGQTQRAQQQRGEEQRVWQDHRASNWQSDHRSWEQRGGYHGYRIPEDRFRGYFGQDHWFRIGGLPFMVEAGYPRFQYQGYWLDILDPWPANWGDGWYDNDDVYVADQDGGYYLFNRRHPGIGIAISISR